MKNIFQFGEEVQGYDIRVLNEREARAAAGILFVFAIIAFMNALLLKDFSIIKIVIIAFLLDFIIRVLINPRYSPSLVLGRLIVQNQKPEYVGAPQKKFAWSLGLGMAITMLFLVVIYNVTGPINFVFCITCLALLFFETSFGICLGCKMYNLFNKEKAKLCPGGACEIRKKEAIQKVSPAQITILILTIILIMYLATSGIFK